MRIISKQRTCNSNLERLFDQIGQRHSRQCNAIIWVKRGKRRVLNEVTFTRYVATGR